MVVTVKLPFSDLHICKVCGSTSHDKARLKACRRTSRTQSTHIKAGATSILCRRRPLSGSFVLDEKPQIWKIEKLFYAKPGDKVTCFSNATQPRVHELCLVLRKGSAENSPVIKLTLDDFHEWARQTKPVIDAFSNY